MRKPRSSNNVSGIQRSSAMAALISLEYPTVFTRPLGRVDVNGSVYPRKNKGRPEPLAPAALRYSVDALSDALPAQQFADGNPLRLERLAQHGNASLRLGVAAHE